jgi:cell division septation protein DedD
VNKIKKKLLIFFITVLPLSSIYSQEVDIIPYLKQIEEGNKHDVQEVLPSLIAKNPESPSIMFLEGVLTEDGNKAAATYSKIVDKYPKSKYADAALYRIFSYYYSIGDYEKAVANLNRLKTDYPVSPYLKIADRNIPAAGQENTLPENKSGENSARIKEENLPKYKFTIQAGAFTKSSNASALKRIFEDNGYFSEIKDKEVAGTTFNVVYVGKFENRDEAENFLNVINKEFKLNGRIVDLP